MKCNFCEVKKKDELTINHNFLNQYKVSMEYIYERKVLANTKQSARKVLTNFIAKTMGVCSHIINAKIDF